ncbi:TadE/TadG family type IV pilus assembly protein [Salipaludibacillus daqingensis]|uniref:TadE/TadG family type IV pilus assembly protein n=1 Tax=Salipaludibacillus daqingensis TaxID=3041001 RepID=UPI002473987C|nr:hypothetical protein [Salipaludibacillus daqingensis]
MAIRKILKRYLQKQNGSMTIEFIGVLPYFFLIFVLLWQVVASGIAVVTTQNALNEASKTYSLTENYTEAQAVASDIIGNSDIVSMHSFNIDPGINSNEYDLEIEIVHGLIFIPEIWRENTSINFSHSTSGRLLE